MIKNGSEITKNTRLTCNTRRQSSTAVDKTSVLSNSKVFKDPIVLYIFEDNQYIKTKETPCYKFDLTIILRKYFMYDETKQQNSQTMTPEEMLQN